MCNCRQIDEYLDYLAFEDGRIFSLKTNVFLKPGSSPNGYLKVNLRNGASRPNFKSVHRIIAETFIPNDNPQLQVNHKNGIKTDNRLENLEWVTRSQNIQHSICETKTFPIGERNANAKLNEFRIGLIMQMKSLGITEKSIAMSFGVSQPTINKITKGKNWKHIKRA